MPGLYFISYSRADASEFALHLHDALEKTAGVKVWLDQLDLVAGGDWSGGIPDALRDCEVVLFVMTRDSVADASVCKKEYTAALSFKKPIVPLRLHPVDLPFLLNTRQWIDFTGDFGVGMARLREYIRWRATPDATLQDLKIRFADAERDLARASDADRPRVQADIDLLRKQIAEQTEAIKTQKPPQRKQKRA